MRNTKKYLRAMLIVCIVMILTLSCASIFSGCGDKKKNAELRSLTEQMIDSIIAKDSDAAYELIKDATTREECDAFLDSVSVYIDDVTGYELKQTGWHWNLDNGIESYTATFNMTTAEGREYEVTAVSIEGYDGIANFNIVEIKNSGILSTPWLIPFKMVGVMITLVAVAFTVWMIVDCSKRRLNKKALWIIAILLGIVGKIAFSSNGFNIGANISLIVPVTRAALSNGLVTMQLAVPVGAIVYFCMRKKLTLPEPTEEENTNTAVPNENRDDAPFE